LDTNQILARMAQMETELSGLRAAQRQPQTPQFDQAAFVRSFIADPIGSMTKMGIPVDHVTKVAVAHALGNEAPPALQAYAYTGPQQAQTQQIASAVQAISRRLDERDQRDNKLTLKQSMQKLAADKAKYPYLSKVFGANPSMFDDVMESHKGSAEDLAAALEKRQAEMAALYGVKLDSQSASGEDAGTNQQAQSQESKPALAGAMSGNVPPLPLPKAGVFTADEDAKLKAEILAKYPENKLLG
jgi:hypothetical protein